MTLSIFPAHKSQKGFALISTITISSLLLLIGIAMLNLSTVTTKAATSSNDIETARANARIALMLAVAKLQETAGSDQRVTADGSILGENVASPHAVGVWESWSPNLSKDIQASSPNYETEKEDRFLRWLVSGDEQAVTERDFVLSEVDTEQIDLFGLKNDGFSLTGALIEVNDANNTGSYAWAISQENTKAKINVSGPELADRDENDDLHAQPRPNVSLSETLQQPTEQWYQRAAKVIDNRQALLDQDLVASSESAPIGADFTSTSFGLLTDTLNGGLKVDLGLGFEMSDSDFSQSSWVSDGTTFTNPFSSGAENDFTVPSEYQSQRPLYQPITDSGTYQHLRPWRFPNLDQVDTAFPVTSVPTFDTLRSHYRIYKHLYESSTNGLTVFERANDHVASAEAGGPEAGYLRPPHIAANGAETQTAIRPVLDRMMYLFSLTLSENDEPRYAITPIITLWNPYNTSLEIEGATSYLWLDVPMRRRFDVYPQTGGRQRSGSFMSRDLTFDPSIPALGRQVAPYVIAAMTADGKPISGNAQPIQFQPGEIRIFTPASSDFEDLILNQTSGPLERTIFLRPVDSIADFDISGGFNIGPRDNVPSPMQNNSDEVDFFFEYLDAHPLSMSLADATLAKSGANNNTRGQIIADIRDEDFGATARSTGFFTDVSPRRSKAELEAEPLPTFLLEVYHRVAESGATEQSSDLVFTGNMRRSSMNPYVANTQFKTGPQYQPRMRLITSTDQIMEVATQNLDRPGGYYGASQSASNGSSRLSFFEVPRSPLLSLAGFQHADLSSSTFAPANQFGNSWASAYVPRDEVADGSDGREVDHTYLVNEAIWDGYFFSGAAPTSTPLTNTGTPSIWDSVSVNESESLEEVLINFATDSSANPLRNPRMQLSPQTIDGSTPEEFAASMIEPAACLQIAQHLMVDGAFNINSTSLKAWTSVLLGLKGASFKLGDSSNTLTSVSNTPFPRFHTPLGAENDNWQGFRTLTDDQIEGLAEQIVEQVRLRGPFLSLGEFINRRVDNDEDTGRSGAIQSAIDLTSINSSATQSSIETSNYDSAEAENIFPQDTGVGIPGYLTQADLLQSLAPIITPRSDTFTIRAYGDARNNSGEVTASVWIEATVQRTTSYVDSTDKPYTQPDQLSTTNQRFGRQYQIVSFRYLANNEVKELTEETN